MITIVMIMMMIIHISAGPHGIGAWIQPPHIAAGIDVISYHLDAWWQVQ